MKTLRTYREWEFIYNPIPDYCKENGVQRQLTVQHTLQQNRVAERKNKTIKEMTRSMLKGKGLPNKFWAKTINIATYILNRSPTKKVWNQTPFESWHKQKPDISYMLLFLLKIETSFMKKREKLIFIGYNDESKGFRLFNPKKDQLLFSRDVIFYEYATWKWEDTVNLESTTLE